MLYLKWFICFLALTPVIVTAQAQSDSAAKPKMAVQYVDIHVVPVGPVPLARFGFSKGDDESKSDSSELEDPSENKKIPSSGPKGFVVLERDARETPPRALYLKQGNGYFELPCHQNSIASPVRVPLTQPEMVFYKRVRSEDGNISYTEYAQATWKPGQKRLLLTLTKNLKDKYWTDAVLRSYNLSPSVIGDKPLIVVNTGKERQVGILMNGHPKVLSPHKKVLIDAPANKRELHFKLGVLLPNRKFHAPVNVSLPKRPNERMLILTFPCDSKESFRGIKVVKGRLVDKQFRKARFISAE